MGALVGDESGGIAVMPAHLPVVEQPPRGPLVEALDVELVDHEHAAATHELSEPPARLGQRVHVMEREHGDGRIEDSVFAVHLEKGDAADVRRPRSRIDRHHLVADLRQSGRQLARAGTDLEHPRRGSRQSGTDERRDGGDRHEAEPYAVVDALT